MPKVTLLMTSIQKENGRRRFAQCNGSHVRRGYGGLHLALCMLSACLLLCACASPYTFTGRPDYYEQLLRTCRVNDRCCQDSVDVMAQGNYSLPQRLDTAEAYRDAMATEGCAQGTVERRLSCGGYSWCEPGEVAKRSS
jgi:hypothetical protein